MSFAFNSDKKFNTQKSDEILSVAILGRHLNGKVASKQECAFCNNILAQWDANRSSRFLSTRGVLKGVSLSGFVTSGRTGTSFPRNIESEKFIHSIQNNHNKLIALKKSLFEKSLAEQKYESVKYPVVTMQTAAKMRIRDSRKRDDLYSHGTKRFDSANPKFFDTNWAYNEASSTPSGLDMFPLVTKETADEFVKEDERKRIRAEQKAKQEEIGKQNRKAINARHAYSYWHDVEASDYDRELFDYKKQYGSRKGESAYRKTLEKEFPLFFKNSKMSTKDMHEMAKTLRKFQKLPFGIGNIITNPIAGISTLALGALTTYLKTSKQVHQWEILESFLGYGSAPFRKSLKDANVGDEGEVTKAYGAMTSWLAALGIGDEGAYKLFTDVARASMGKVDLTSINEHSTPEDIAKILIPQMGGLSFNERLRTVNALKKYGITENVLKGMEFYATGNTPESYKAIGDIQEIKDQAKRDVANGLITSAIYDIPYLGDALAFVANGIDNSLKSLANPFGDAHSRIISVAEADDEFDRSGSGANSGAALPSLGSKSFSWYIDNLNVQADDKDALQSELMGASNAKSSSNAEVLDAFTPYKF